MKKVLFLMVVAVLVSAWAAIAATVSIEAGKSVPANVVVKEIVDPESDYDTLDAAANNVFGPIKMSQDRTFPAFTYLKLALPTGAIASGDSIEVSYASTPTTYVTDTAASPWTALDTLIAGKTGTVKDFSALIVPYVWLRVRNIDATGVKFSKPLYGIFKGPMTASPDTK